MSCGKRSLQSIEINRLRELGLALDAERHLFVFRNGFVGNCQESEVNKHDAATLRSAARPRARQRKSERTWWRPTGQTERFGSDAIEAAFGDQFRILAQNYPALAFEGTEGLWVVVESTPLGSDGPKIHFAISFRLDAKSIPLQLPRAWAFRVYPDKLVGMPFKHTNFPDASICAFVPDDGTWSWDDGMMALVDHYSIWAVKSLHRQYLGTWPGRQHGICAHYRRKEFSSGEWCGCQSGKRYRDCHQGIDLLVDPEFAEVEFRRLFGCDYLSRDIPQLVTKFAAMRWRNPPPLALV